MRMDVPLNKWYIVTLLLTFPLPAFTQTDTASIPTPAKHQYALKSEGSCLQLIIAK